MFIECQKMMIGIYQNKWSQGMFFSLWTSPGRGGWRNATVCVFGQSCFNTRTAENHFCCWNGQKISQDSFVPSHPVVKWFWSMAFTVKSPSSHHLFKPQVEMLHVVFCQRFLIERSKKYSELSSSCKRNHRWYTHYSQFMWKIFAHTEVFSWVSFSSTSSISGVSGGPVEPKKVSEEVGNHNTLSRPGSSRRARGCEIPWIQQF